MSHVHVALVVDGHAVVVSDRVAGVGIPGAIRHVGDVCVAKRVGAVVSSKWPGVEPEHGVLKLIESIAIQMRGRRRVHAARTVPTTTTAFEEYQEGVGASRVQPHARRGAIRTDRSVHVHPRPLVGWSLFDRPFTRVVGQRVGLAVVVGSRGKSECRNRYQGLKCVPQSCHDREQLHCACHGSVDAIPHACTRRRRCGRWWSTPPTYPTRSLKAAGSDSTRP